MTKPKSIRERLVEMSQRRREIDLITEIGKKRQAEIALQKDMDELSKMPLTPEELKLIDDFADGSNIAEE